MNYKIQLLKTAIDREKERIKEMEKINARGQLALDHGRERLTQLERELVIEFCGNREVF